MKIKSNVFIWSGNLNMSYLEHGEHIIEHNPVAVTKPTPTLGTPYKKVTEEIHTRIPWYIRSFERAFRF